MNRNVYYAGLRKRFLALSLDFLIFCIVFFPSTKIIKGVWIMSVSDHRWSNGLLITDPICILFLVVMFLYFVLLEGWISATLGKLVVGLRVKKINGAKPGIKKSFFRNILRLVDGLPTLNILGIIMILTSDEKARFGDRIAGTRVVDIRR